MINQVPDRKSRVDRYYEFWSRLSERRQKTIRKSLVRPLYQEVLKTLFYIAVLLVDSLIPLQFLVSFSSPINIIGTLLSLGIFLYIEVRIYNDLWGKNGRWALQKYEETPQGPKPEK